MSANECQRAAVEAGTTSQALTEPNIPHGCIHQVIDNVFVYNQAGTYYTNDGMDWHERDWCPQGVEDVCIIRAVCAPDWWQTRKIGHSQEHGECFLALSGCSDGHLHRWLAGWLAHWFVAQVHVHCCL